MPAGAEQTQKGPRWATFFYWLSSVAVLFWSGSLWFKWTICLYFEKRNQLGSSENIAGRWQKIAAAVGGIGPSSFRGRWKTVLRKSVPHTHLYPVHDPESSKHVGEVCVHMGVYFYILYLENCFPFILFI